MFGDDYKLRTQYSADLIHRRALEWIDSRNKEKPFIGLLTYTLPHAELSQPNDSLLQRYKKRFFTDKTWGGQEASRYNPVEHTHAHFAAMISRLDAYVGEIMEHLKKQGLADNTIVIFTSDNGPHEEGGADPEFFGRDGKLRGLKRECYEGGIRIPFIVKWPGHVQAGTENDHQLAFYDVLPTLAEIAGFNNIDRKYRHQKDNRFDGLSFLPTLLGQNSQKTHPYLYWELSETQQFGVRKGPWKLVVKRGTPLLYNLDNDLHEDHDVAAQHPDLVRQLIDIIYTEHTDNPYFPVTLPKKQ